MRENVFKYTFHKDAMSDSFRSGLYNELIPMQGVQEVVLAGNIAPGVHNIVIVAEKLLTAAEAFDLGVTVSCIIEDFVANN